MPARKAHTQAHPRVAGLYAILADRDVLWMDVANLIFMGAGLFGHTTIIPPDGSLLSQLKHLHIVSRLLFVNAEESQRL